MKASELQSQLAKSVSDLYRVTCKDALSVNLVKKSFAQLVPKEDREVSLITAEANYPIEEIVTEARTFSFIPSRKIIFVEHRLLLNEKDKKLLLDYAQDEEKSSTIVFFDEDKTFDFLSKFCTPIEGISSEKGELSAYISSKFKEKNFAIDYQAAEKLAYFCGASPERIDKEIEKLLYYKAEEKTITSQDVEIIVSEDMEVKAFDLTNYFTKKQYSKAVEVLESQLRHGVKPIALLSALSSSYRKLFFISLIKDEQEAANLLNTSLSAIRVNKKIIEQSGYTQAKLKKIIDRLYEAEYGFKSGKYSDKSALDLVTAYLITV